MNDSTVISDFQAGGKKGRATTDHIIVLKELIRAANKLNKPLYTFFCDVKQAYDKASLDTVLYSANKRGLEGNTWQLIKELNSNLTAVVRTKHGPTDPFEIDGVTKQGAISSNRLYSGQIDDITPLIKELNVGVHFGTTGLAIAVLHWVDDILRAFHFLIG